MKGVLISGDSQVLVVSALAKPAVLQKADHGYQRVIGCGVIFLAVDHVNRFKPVRNCCECAKPDRAAGERREQFIADAI
jgi:hypothetical protein